MSACFKPSRLFVPRGGFEKWAIPSWERSPDDEAFWERVARTAGNAPSAFGFYAPDAAEETAEQAKMIADAMYRMLETETVERIERGAVFTERNIGGRERYGIVMAADLEAYSFREGEPAMIRATLPPSPRAERLALLRETAPLEFPYVTLFYQEKRDRAASYLRRGDLEPLYSFELMEGGGQIKGSYIPPFEAEMIAEQITPRTGTGFVVAEGHDLIAAAKLRWEKLKPTLDSTELDSHPARFILVELVNLFATETELVTPVRRVITEEEDAFRDYFRRNVKCKERDGALLPATSDPAAIRKADAVIAEYLRINGGRVKYDVKPSRDEGVCVRFGAFDADELFPAVKGGKLLPPYAFTVREEQMRYCLEGREISYD